jgi:hypothetical protein
VRNPKKAIIKDTAQITTALSKIDSHSLQYILLLGNKKTMMKPKTHRFDHQLRLLALSAHSSQKALLHFEQLYPAAAG